MGGEGRGWPGSRDVWRLTGGKGVVQLPFGRSDQRLEFSGQPTGHAVASVAVVKQPLARLERGSQAIEESIDYVILVIEEPACLRSDVFPTTEDLAIDEDRHVESDRLRESTG